ncbi:MAG: hypothetical protein ACI85Q_002760, partial [Salibacteraceae bacterium]
MKSFSPTKLLLLFLILHFPSVAFTSDDFTQTTICDPITDGGTISANQNGFIGGFNPITIQNTSPATGGIGTIEYKWMESDYPVPSTDAYWTEISGANSATYNPSFITKTTYLIRLAKNNTCSDWDRESNRVKLFVPSTPITSCLLYAVQDKKSSDYSQLFTVDVFNGNTISNLGPQLDGWDIEGLEVDENTGILYGSSGNDNTHGFDGYFYSIDAVSGAINVLGPTGYDDVVSLAYHPNTNVLYAWVDDYGLITINTQTGAGSMVYSSPLDFDGMAWSNDGTKLYVATDKKDLSIFNPVTGAVTLLTSTMPGPVESLEMRPDGNLMFGTHLSSTTIYTINPFTLQIQSASNISTPFDDIESIVWPDWCALSINVSVSINNALCNGSADGTAIITGSNGVSPYTYFWNTGEVVNSKNDLTAGNYSVTVIDANGVSDSVAFTITEPTILTTSVQSVQATCTGSLADGTMNTVNTGGTAPLT